MPDWTNSKLFSVLLAAALALSCYPVPVRAFADEGASYEGDSGSWLDSVGSSDGYFPSPVSGGVGLLPADGGSSPEFLFIDPSDYYVLDSPDDGDFVASGVPSVPDSEAEAGTVLGEAQEDISSLEEGAAPLVGSDFVTPFANTSSGFGGGGSSFGGGFGGGGKVGGSNSGSSKFDSSSFVVNISNSFESVKTSYLIGLLQILSPNLYDGSSGGWSVFDLLYYLTFHVAGNIDSSLSTFSSNNRTGINNLITVLSGINTNINSTFWQNGYSSGRMLYELWDDTDRLLYGSTHTVGSTVYYFADILFYIWNNVDELEGELRASVDGNVLSAAQLLGHIRGRLGADRDGSTYGVGSLVSMTYDRLAVNEDGSTVSVSGFLQQIRNRLQYVDGSNTYTAGGMLYRIMQSLASVDGSLHITLDGADINAAQLLGHIRGRLGADRDGSTYGVGSLVSMTYDRLAVNEDGSTVSVSGFLQQIRNRLQYVDGSNTYTAGGLLYRIWQSLGSLSAPDVTVDNSGVESRLDDIKNLLLLGAMSDVLNTLLGDFHAIIGDDLVGSIGDALSTAFPFCIPAVVKQVLGLLVYEGAPPVFEFDIGGASLVLDFSVVSGFAEISRWVTTVAFVLVLLANTKRFIFDFSGGAS